MNAFELQQQIHMNMPLTQHMGFSVLELSLKHIVVSGGGQQNVNVHGTAFAGSLYTLCTLATWGLVYSRLPDDVELVMASAKIEYRRPVSTSSDIQAQCAIDGATSDQFLSHLMDKRKANIIVNAKVDDMGQTAVLFRAKLHARYQ